MILGLGLDPLGGSWVVISGVIRKVTIVTTHIRGLITLLMTTHEPPSIATTYNLPRERSCPETQEYTLNHTQDPSPQRTQYTP